MCTDAEFWLPSMFDNLPDGVIYWQAVRDDSHQLIDFRIGYTNRSALAISLPLVDVELGKLLLAHYLIHSKGVKRLFDQYETLLASGESQTETYWHEELARPLCVTRSRVGDGVLLIFKDQSDQHQRDRLLAELKRSNEYLEQFAYVASHDLQEPLRKVIAFGDALREQYALQLDNGGADLLARMQAAAKRMQVLIRDVLAYSRLTNVQERFRLVNVNELVNEVLYDLETVIVDKQADIQVTGLCQMRADPLQFRQLFQNLIGNGLKFARTDESGKLIPPKLVIDCRQLSQDEVERTPFIEQERHCTYYQITVVDNGIGFEPHQADKIFNVFQRLHNRHHYEGTGIGLAIVRRVVENHRGYILAEGKPNEGACFRVYIPAF